MKKKLIATVIILSLTGCSLTACGGGGSSDPTPPQSNTPVASPPWELSILNDGGRLATSGLACGGYDIVTTGDLNNDGNDDFILGPKVKFSTADCTSSAFAKPVMAMYDPATKSYNTNAICFHCRLQWRWI